MVSLTGFAQQSCPDRLYSFSRELFPRSEVKFQSSDCKPALQPGLIDVENVKPDSFRYFKVDSNPQDSNGRDLYLGVETSLLVNKIIYSRPQ